MRQYPDDSQNTGQRARKIATLLMAVLTFVGSAAYAEQTFTLSCNGWKVNSIQFMGTLTSYKITGNCSAYEKIDNVHLDLAGGQSFDGTLVKTLQGATMDVSASFDSVSGKASEVATLNRAGYSSNGNAAATATTMPGATPAVLNSSAHCNRDPFQNLGTPGCTGVTHGDAGTIHSWPYQESVNVNGNSYHTTFNPTVNGGAFPAFLAVATVDPSAVKKQDLQNLEDKVQNVQLTSPKPNVHLYSQDVLIQVLIPSKYKKDGQSCCTVEMQKSNGQNGWLPTLPLGNKANVVLNGYNLPFGDFQAIGYGLWRVRVAPQKFNPNDFQPWSDWVVFEVMPKEILEVPNIVLPVAAQSYANAIPVQIKVPDIAKKAGVKCCEIEMQIARTPGAWGASKNMSEPRLGTDDNAVQYDAKTLVPGGGDVRLRVRFSKADGEALGWSGWRAFTVPLTGPLPGPQLKLQTPTATPAKK